MKITYSSGLYGNLKSVGWGRGSSKIVTIVNITSIRHVFYCNMGDDVANCAILHRGVGNKLIY